MPVVIACPNCQTKLRVPEDVLGKKVKCSQCATAFTAEAPESESGPTEVQEKPTAPAAARGRAAPPPEEDLEDDEELEDEDEEEEDRPRRRRRRPPDPMETLIPYRNGKALAAYYCGVFSFIPCVGLILGPIALIFGILGLRYAKAHPTARGAGHAIAGIVMGSLTTLVYWGLTLFGIIGAVVSAAHGH